MKSIVLTSVAVVLQAASLMASATTTELVVDYPYPGIFKNLQEELASRFIKANPDISIKFSAPATDYEQANQRVLLQSVTGQTPDITFQGLNRQRVLIDKGIPVDLTPFIAGDKDYAGLGLNENLLKVGQSELVARTRKVMTQLKDKERELEELKLKMASGSNVRSMRVTG